MGRDEDNWGHASSRRGKVPGKAFHYACRAVSDQMGGTPLPCRGRGLAERQDVRQHAPRRVVHGDLQEHLHAKAKGHIRLIHKGHGWPVLVGFQNV